QVPALLVAEGSEAWAQTLGDLTEPDQPRPRLDVPHRRGAERGEVAHDQLVNRGAEVEGPAEPRVGGGPDGLARGAPDAARWQLDDRHQVADGVREGLGVAVRPLLPEQRAKVAQTPGP